MRNKAGVSFLRAPTIPHNGLLSHVPMTRAGCLVSPGVSGHCFITREACPHIPLCQPRARHGARAPGLAGSDLLRLSRPPSVAQSPQSHRRSKLRPRVRPTQPGQVPVAAAGLRWPGWLSNDSGLYQLPVVRPVHKSPVTRPSGVRESPST